MRRTVGDLIGEWNRIGSQARFYATALRSILNAVINYRTELVRLIAQMGMGAGALAAIGGAVGVFGSMLIFTGSLVGSEAYTQFRSIGTEALTGLAGSVLNIRFIVLGSCVIAMSATVGAGATAELGAMRINEEIDALEVMGVRSVAFLVSTRIVAGVVVAIPLYAVAATMGFLASREMATVYYGLGAGVYDHYFNTFLNPTDMMWSFSSTVVLTVVVMLIHTYYGFNAAGGPAGVGEAVGRAVRASLVIAAVGVVMISLAAYGHSGNIHLAG